MTERTPALSSRKLVGDERCYVAGEVAVAGSFEGAVVIDVDVGALLGDAEAAPNLELFVGDVGEACGARAVDELREIGCARETGHAKDGHLIAELLLYLHDRGGFCTSERSPRCPEPKHHVLALQRGEVDRLAPNGYERAIQR